MVSFKTILFPVDFSKQCEKAALSVAAFARYFDAEVVTLHTEVLPAEPYVWQPQTKLMVERLNEFTAAYFPDLPTRAFVRLGDPAHVIVDAAQTEKVDLIMLPTHGRGPFRRFVLGSVSTKVLHDAPCPVWTAAHIEHIDQTAPSEVKSMVCAIDMDERGKRILLYANDLAQTLNATLTVAHAVPAVQTWPEAYLDVDFQTDLIKTARNHLTELLETKRIPAKVCVGAGDIGRFVAEAAQSQDAHLVVIGRGGHGLLGRLRTHDYAIIRHCPCPVLSI